jgi:hypothetical protein
VTNTYREVLYLFLQRFVFHGQMTFFGTVSNPAGCAVAYRRTYLEALFDAVEPQLGDDLTNSEDIFIGLAMLNEGYRNVQVIDVLARTVEPEVQRLPKQLNLWSSAFLQSAFYFDALLKSPFKALKRRRMRRGTSGGSGRRLQPVAATAGSVAGRCRRAGSRRSRLRLAPNAAASRNRIDSPSAANTHGRSGDPQVGHCWHQPSRRSASPPCC